MALSEDQEGFLEQQVMGDILDETKLGKEGEHTLSPIQDSGS